MALGVTQNKFSVFLNFFWFGGPGSNKQLAEVRNGQILTKRIKRQSSLSNRRGLYYRILWPFNIRIEDLWPGWLMRATAEEKLTITSS